MKRLWKWVRVASPMWAALLVIVLRSSSSFAGEDACFTEVGAKLTAPYALFAVSQDALTKKPVYTFLRQRGCESGACSHVFVSHLKEALPVASIAGAKGDVVKAHGDGACGGQQAYSVTYANVPVPAAGSCEEKTSKVAAPVDVVVFVANAGASARVLKGAACSAATCSVRYVTSDALAALAASDVHILEGVCTESGGSARYVDVRPATVRLSSAGAKQQKILERYRSGDVTAVDRESLGVDAAASPVAAAAGEVLQILGQIVVDRATEAAYQRARDEILRLLGCSPAETPAGAPAMLLGAKIKFPRTCRVVQSVRLQELAMSRAAILQALIQDVVEALPKVPETLAPGAVAPGGAAGPGAKPNGDLRGTLSASLALVANDLLPDLSRVASGGGSAATGTLVWQLIQKGLTHAGEAIETCPDQACKATALASVAVVQCRLQAMAAKPKERAAVLLACPVEDIVDQLSGSPPELDSVVIATAKSIASGWMSAQTAVTPEGAPDLRARARFAVSTAFDVGCLWLDPTDIQKAKCPAELETEDKAALARRVASLTRLLILAAIDGDTNTIIAGLSKGVDLVLSQVDASSLSPAEKKALHRGLRLLGALLQYSETFAKNGTKEDAQALHERRTKILESLTREMTDREGRENDNIFSLGGSLRAVVGMRLDPSGASGATFLGPVALPLGVGFQSASNWHVEIGLFDLGQYVSYQDSSTGLQVREPEPADVLSPSLTVGRYWGKSFPFFVGLTFGYAPQYKFKIDAPGSVGSLNLGLTTGIYVPLFDLN